MSQSRATCASNGRDRRRSAARPSITGAHRSSLNERSMDQASRVFCLPARRLDAPDGSRGGLALPSKEASFERSLLGRWPADRSLGLDEEASKPNERLWRASGARRWAQAEADFHGQKRFEATPHASTHQIPMPGFIPQGKARGEELCFNRAWLMETRHVLLVDSLPDAGYGRPNVWRAAHGLSLVPGPTDSDHLGADKAYDVRRLRHRFALDERDRGASVCVSARGSVESGSVPQLCESAQRKLPCTAAIPSASSSARAIEEAFCWIKTIAGQERPSPWPVIASHGLLPSHSAARLQSGAAAPI